MFEERQMLSWKVVLVIAVLVLGIDVGVWLSDSDHGLPIWISSVVVALLLAMTRMRTIVMPDELEVKMFLVLPHRCAIDDVDRWEVVEYRPLRDYGGWGWRWGGPKRGWCYTMRGNRGVLVHLRNGKRFLVGSQRPDELAAAIAGAKRGRPSAA